jgi:hypothetical protein
MAGSRRDQPGVPLGRPGATSGSGLRTDPKGGSVVEKDISEQ